MSVCVWCHLCVLLRRGQSINQSKVLTKPDVGNGEATSQHHHRGQQTRHHEVIPTWGAVKSRNSTSLRNSFILLQRGRYAAAHACRDTGLPAPCGCAGM